MPKATADLPKNPVFVALDSPDPAQLSRLANLLVGQVGGLKVGKEFFTACGPRALREAIGTAPLFLDLKFHDIPNTVAGALRSAVALAPTFVTLHASGGTAMMTAARQAAEEAAAEAGLPRPWLLGVTVLTSLDEADLEAVGQKGPIEDQVRRLAALAQASGLDGVVCSPREIEVLRRDLDPGFLLMVPGIRPAWAAKGDQKRVMTPGEALSKGASFLVIGRPITGDADPLAAAERIAAELAAAGQ
jgi:orotidine-5'-phosphate decarboxylase